MKDTLLATVIDEYAAVEAFASVLACEEKALTAVSPLELLPPIIEMKTELVEKLSSLEKQRDSQLAELGFPPGWRGMELASSADPRLATQWALLQKAAERAKALQHDQRRADPHAHGIQPPRPRRAQGAQHKAGLYGPDGRIPSFGRV